MSVEVKNSFIGFLRSNHALEEYKEEVVAQSNYENTFDTHVLRDIDTDGFAAAEYIMSDGYAFFFKSAVTDVAWRDLERVWNHLVLKNGWLKE